ncbi:MAG: hypothetical protein LUC38_08335 [Oscillospiraceae bacterium]|nr:hypothetical protein [Ruminococcus sp.]MCD8345940.1 hypothetical protein [Oscillospiraceae bacterium]
MSKMSTRDYYDYKSAIEAANSAKDKDALKKIKMQLIANYGLSDSCVQELLRKFGYSV